MKLFFRFFIPVFIFLFSFNSSQAQLDISGNFQLTTFSDWDEAVKEHYKFDEDFFKQAYGGGIAYHIYPWDFRLGFIPELSFAYLNDEKSNQFLGINTFGIRLRHEVMESWLNDQKTIDEVIEKLEVEKE